MAATAAQTVGRIPIKLLGFGLPYDKHTDDVDALRLSAVLDWSHPVITVRERCMLFFMNKITDKPQWEQKCIDELRAKATLIEKTGVVPILDVSSYVLKSDTAVSSDLRAELRKAVSVLEDIPDHQKDWHPGSDGKVLDLVHPSLYPLVYQRTRILPYTTISVQDCLEYTGEGTVIPDPRTDPEAGKSGWVSSKLWSSRFQWLPCEVSFPDGTNARIDSYVNNLHPTDHKDLYSSLEKLITKAIPLWNIVYQGIENGQRIGCNCVEYTYPPSMATTPENFDNNDDEYEWYERREESRIYTKPDLESKFVSLNVTPKDFEDKFKFLEGGEKKIQVIIKLANIHLTPENPEYTGGLWHIEGQLNEHIVSTALYYYDNDNVTDSHLSFRTNVQARNFSEDLYYEQSDYTGIEKIFGIKDDDDTFQEIGSVLTREDRLIAFPNGFQHRVQGFKLADPTMPGHRKIVALFLVAPRTPVISTANIPPQQRDWWLREIKESKSKVSQLPTELIDMIGEEVQEFPIGLAEAKVLREELMAERGRIDKDVHDQLTEEGFNFCEH